MIKTHKGTAKRFKLTKKKKVKFQHAGKGHILTKKSSKRKRNMRKGAYLSDTRFVKTISKLLPHG